MIVDAARQGRYEAARAEGRAWAVEQLAVADDIEAVKELRDLTVGDAPAAYVALRMGRLPTPFPATEAERDEGTDLSEGFFDGAMEVLDARRRELTPPSPPRRARRGKVKRWRP